MGRKKKKKKKKYSPLRRISSAGNVYYYYYKKKRPNKQPPWLTSLPPIDYKIISTNRCKQNECIGWYSTIDEASLVMNELLSKNEEVIFPVEWNNGFKTLIKANHEYLLLKKNRNGNQKITPKLPNEIGKLVDHIIENNEIWFILDKKPKLVEETFWVYGYDPRFGRKTFMWFFENVIVDKLTNSRYDEKVVVLFRNKLIVLHNEKKFDMVICKNKSDAIRFYNLLEEKCKKIKQVFFFGQLKRTGEFRKNVLQMIKDETGWNDIKINRQTTRP